MPVAEKISKMGNTWINIIPCEISQKTAWVIIEKQIRYEKIYISEHDDNLLTATYNAVVKFIKQYNEEDKQC